VKFKREVLNPEVLTKVKNIKMISQPNECASKLDDQKTEFEFEPRTEDLKNKEQGNIIETSKKPCLYREESLESLEAEYESENISAEQMELMHQKILINKALHGATIESVKSYSVETVNKEINLAKFEDKLGAIELKMIEHEMIISTMKLQMKKLNEENEQVS